MVRKSLVAVAAAFSLLAGTAQAAAPAPAAASRVASPIDDSESLSDDDGWIGALIAILAVILIIVLVDQSGEQDLPTSP